MSIVLDGTSGITSPGGDTATVSVATPIVQSPSSLTLKTNGTTTAVTINTSQQVGIGTASPSALLHVLTSGVTAGIKSETSGSFGGIELKATNGVTQDWIVAADASGSGKFAIYDAVAGQYRMQINGTGNVILSGGTGTANGVGITFPATQSASTDANTLDDYEEGTWTPVFSNITMSGTIVYGYYTKVGNVVNLYWFFSRTSSSGPSGQMSVTGIPFPSVGTQVPYFGTVAFENVNFASAYAICLIGGTSNSISFAPIANNATFSYIQNSAFNGGAGWVCGSISYRAA